MLEYGSYKGSTRLCFNFHIAVGLYKYIGEVDEIFFAFCFQIIPYVDFYRNSKTICFETLQEKTKFCVSNGSTKAGTL